MQRMSNTILRRPDLVAEARRYLGTNPTDRKKLWCAAFMNLVLNEAGYDGTHSDAARSFAYYGRRISEPEIGAIAVLTRGKNGGHVGVVSGIDAQGNPIIISGNHNKRVGEAVYPRARVIAYVMPTESHAATDPTCRPQRAEPHVRPISRSIRRSRNCWRRSKRSRTNPSRAPQPLRALGARAPEARAQAPAAVAPAPDEAHPRGRNRCQQPPPVPPRMVPQSAPPPCHRGRAADAGTAAASHGAAVAGAGSAGDLQQAALHPVAASGASSAAAVRPRRGAQRGDALTLSVSPRAISPASITSA